MPVYISKSTFSDISQVLQLINYIMIAIATSSDNQVKIGWKIIESLEIKLLCEISWGSGSEEENRQGSIRRASLKDKLQQADSFSSSQSQESVFSHNEHNLRHS